MINMWIIKQDDNILHDPRTNDEVVTSCTCTLKADSAGSLVFTMSKTNPMYDGLFVMDASHEIVLVECDSDGTEKSEVFRGRVKDPGLDIKGNRAVTCEDQLAYLNDSVVRPYGTYADTVTDDTDTPDWTTIVPDNQHDYAEWLITQHNEQSDDTKQFSIGKNELSTKSIMRSSTGYPNTGAEILSKVVDEMGCYLRVYTLNGVRYIDFLLDSFGTTTQVVDFGKNLLDYATTTDTDDLYTFIIPSGQSSSDDTTAENITYDVIDYVDGPVVGYDGCNKQDDYILYEPAVMKYGKIGKKVSYNSVSSVNNLVSLCCEDLLDVSSIVESIAVSAVDLSHFNSSIDPICLLNRVEIRSDVHNTDKYMLCLQISLDINNPSQTKYTFGATEKTLERSTALRSSEQAAAVSDVVESVKPISATAKAAAETAEAAQESADTKTKTTYGTTYPTTANEGDIFVNTSTNVVYRAKEAY